MTPRLRDRLAAPVVAVYWAALVVGLVVYSTAREDASDVVFLWAGALGGTVLGQALALKNLRAWLALVIIGGVALVFAPMLAAGGAPTVLWQVLVPAALCGYLSLGERTAAAAFWFPAMTWMLTVVDRLDSEDAAATMDARAFLLLGGVAVALLAMLWAAEQRRLGLWRTVGGVAAGRAAMLREPAGRALSQVAWWASVAALTVALTAWMAPHLWQSETLGGQRVTEFADGIGVGDRDGIPCCPLVSAEAPRVRVREFLDVAHGVTRPPARVGVNCTACSGTGWVLAGAGVGNGAVVAPAAEMRPSATTSAAPSSLPSVQPAVARPTPPEPTVPPPSPPEPEPRAVAAPSLDVEPQPRIDEPTMAAEPAARPSLQAPPVASAMRPAPTRPPADHAGLIKLLLTLLAGAVAFATATLTLRPLRRALTLRHLRQPYWAETLEQRVSNLWQLALVGLRDAGFRARPGEQPEELARRVRVDGVGDCASVLERARHGLGLGDDDLGAMGDAADLAYRAARARLGWLARVAAAVRWPLA